MVTAELATLMPFGFALAFALLWVVSLGLTQVRLTDAARDGARLIARGETADAARLAAQEHTAPGTRVDIDVTDGVVTVRVRATSRLPVPFFAGVGARDLEAHASAVVESP